jgi:predicted nucleotidyltransferase
VTVGKPGFEPVKTCHKSRYKNYVVERVADFNIVTGLLWPWRLLIAEWKVYRLVVIFRHMDRSVVIRRLKEHRAELERLGVLSASVFGSIARGDQTSQSDIDIAVTLDPRNTPRGFAHISRLETIESVLRHILGSPVDVIDEPVRRPDIQAAIDRDRIRAY